jgi:hypothetical protein
MITISYGTRRMVLAVPKLGIVIKFARLVVRRKGPAKLKDHWEQLTWDWKIWLRHPSCGWSYFQDEFLPDLRVGLSLKEVRVLGIQDNRQERQYWRRTDTLRRRLLVPTYVSFLGLFNVQEYREPSRASEIFWAVRHALSDEVHDWEDFDWHHFVNAANFHLTADNQLLFFDYGDRKTQKVIDEHALTRREMEAMLTALGTPAQGN